MEEAWVGSMTCHTVGSTPLDSRPDREVEVEAEVVVVVEMEREQQLEKGRQPAKMLQREEEQLAFESRRVEAAPAEQAAGSNTAAVADAVVAAAVVAVLEAVAVVDILTTVEQCSNT